ncbi:MAG: nucleoside transporter C-terminal domain-containing protein, partial [Candidatus Sericytochromatia bacterium]|nr:nucleoside transporter C-terminal domain-containing protein [Candidatus Sericytochromatia bacterium]
MGLLGMVVVLGLGWALSTHRTQVRWKPVLAGLGLQFALAVFILKFPPGQWLFQRAGAGVTTLLDFSKQGAGFVFGGLLRVDSYGFIFAFQVLPTIIFMAAVISVLYYLGVVQRVVAGLAFVMRKAMGTSGPETLSAAACVFVGQVEGPLLVRPYIARMSRSELMALMTGGMATIAGGVMAAYIGMLGRDWAPALLAASLMGAPGGLAMAKLIVPETEERSAVEGAALAVEVQESSVIEAAAKGASDGMHLAFTVAAMLIAFVSLVALLNATLGWLGALFGQPGVSLETVLGLAFYPLALVLGVPAGDAAAVANLIGTKLVLNEFLSYASLKE